MGINPNTCFNGAAFLTNAETFWSARLRPAISCFNGAAFSRTRKPGRPLRHAERLFGFNGAAFSRTRKRIAHLGVDGERHASMGPRSHERGNTVSHETLHRLRPASMGPRSHERGNKTLRLVSVLTLLCFNGAAFSRTRKQCFRRRNDAPPRHASMGPRSHERGNGSGSKRHPRSACRLQWGRVLTNAETERLEAPPQVGVPASMGPRSHERGNSLAESGTASDVDLLQWGRVLTNAETCSVVFDGSHDRLASMGPRSHERGNPYVPLGPNGGGAGFNGAAFSRTRKLCRSIAARCGVRASMGPRSHERGNDAHASATDGLEGASMGPRSHERGNLIDNTFTNSNFMLQWGRVLTNAETRRAAAGPDVRSYASMGPRSHERGNCRARQRYKLVAACFMGPRSHERGNRAFLLCTRPNHRASMGPRSHERGNSSQSEERPLHQRRSFNGAAFSRTRKHYNSVVPGRDIIWLQWGRVLTNAETALSRSGALSVGRASMGPRFSRTRKRTGPST